MLPLDHRGRRRKQEDAMASESCPICGDEADEDEDDPHGHFDDDDDDDDDDH